MKQQNDFAAHTVAGGLALFYAYETSSSAYVTTGMQFVFPLAIVLLVHFVWMGINGKLVQGFSQVVLGRALRTCLWGTLVIVLVATFSPVPAHSSSERNGLQAVLAVLICLAVLSIVILAFIGLLVFLDRAFRRLFRVIKRSSNRPDKNRVQDFGTLIAAFLIVVGASLEGVPAAYNFASQGQTSSIHFVAASPDVVWKAVSKSTSPEFPLPQILQAFPQPVEVVVDEGADLGSRRVVRIKGREGEGLLTLKVVERSDTQVVFRVLSDTSPIANWIGHKTLSYSVLPDNDGTQLTVSLDYERKLSPAWFFTPTMKVAAYFALDVLARDTKERAEREL
ncbi:MAG: SRPBCC family protein [Pseudomonadota bacterium]